MEHADIEQEMADFYQDLLSEPRPERLEVIRKITRNIPSLVTEDENATLLRSVTLAEVDHAIKEFPDRKSVV